MDEAAVKAWRKSGLQLSLLPASLTPDPTHAQVPPPFDKEETRERLRKAPGGPSAPLNVHLRQEIDRLNTILRLTSTTLKNLRLAVAGVLLACLAVAHASSLILLFIH